MDENNLKAEIEELRRKLDLVTGALERIDRITECAGFNVGGPIEHANAAQNPALSTELMLTAHEYLKDISKVTCAALAAVRKPAGSPAGEGG